MTEFSFKTQPYKHQKETFVASRDREYFALFLEQGLGKTKIVLDTAAWLMLCGKIDRLLIAAPNGVHTNWIKNEVPTHLVCESESYIWDGPPGVKKGRRLNEVISGPCDGKLRILAMNIEALRTDRGFRAAQAFLLGGPGLMCVDESTSIKSIHAEQTKAAIGLGTLARFRRTLTGTPMSQNPIDVYSQCKFLKDTALPIRTLTAFKASFAMEELCSFHNRTFKKIVGFRNLDMLGRMLADFSIRLEKKDCLDLPEKIYTTRYVEMTPEQASIYKAVKDKALVMLSQGTLTTTTALAIAGKCAQITTGFVYNDDKTAVEIKNHRIAAMLDVIEDGDGKFIIWCPFLHNVKMVRAALAEKYGHESVVTYEGATSLEDRDDAVFRLQNVDSCRFFVCTEAASRGLTLTAACNAIYYGNKSKLEARLQSEDRCHRIGQKYPVTYTDLVIQDTVDERVLALLRNKGELASVLTENIKRFADFI